MPDSRAEQPDIDAIVAAVESFDLRGTAEWSKLAVLSENTELDGLRVVPDGLFTENNRFWGLVTIFVVRHYKKEFEFSEGDSFPAEFRGHIENGKPQVDEMSVDTSSFFAGSELASE